MSLLDYSVTLVAKSPENINDIRTMFDEVRAVINDLDNENIASDAGIDYSKLNIPNGTIPVADLNGGSAGQLLVPSGAEVPTWRTMSGDGEMSATGVFTLDQQFSLHKQSGVSAPLNPYIGVIPGCQTPNLAAGTWLLFAKIEVEQGDGGRTGHATFQIEEQPANTAQAVFKVSAEAFDSGAGFGIGSMVSNGSEYARLTYTGAATSTLAAATVRGVLLAVKVS